jgi:hypothetical protein
MTWPEWLIYLLRELGRTAQERMLLAFCVPLILQWAAFFTLAAKVRRSWALLQIGLTTAAYAIHSHVWPWRIPLEVLTIFCASMSLALLAGIHRTRNAIADSVRIQLARALDLCLRGTIGLIAAESVWVPFAFGSLNVSRSILLGGGELSVALAHGLLALCCVVSLIRRTAWPTASTS